jgi:putative transposase
VVVVRVLALRDFGQAMANFFAGTHRKPTWRKARRDEGFRIVAVRPERRARTRTAIARIKASEADVCKDWCEKTSTDLARRFDVICIEDLSITNMTRTAKGTIAEPGRNVRQKTGLNREIRRSGWGLLVRRLEDKAPGRVQKVNPAYTSQTCSQCRTTDREARESQAVFRCRTCGYCGNADTNAAMNIAAGHAVNARGGDRAAGPVNREPQLALLAS